MRTPLTSRPLDFVYFVYFLVSVANHIMCMAYCACLDVPHETHIPASAVVDFQSIYPPALVPESIRKLTDAYVQFSGDPLVGGSLGVKNMPGLTWFKTFVYLEL